MPTPGPPDRTATDQVTAALAERIESGGSLHAEQVAHGLAVSSGHLRRMLRAEGTSLLELRDTLLREEAVTRLGRGESVETTALRLGFAEPRSFRRAFKRWTGTAPSDHQPG